MKYVKINGKTTEGYVDIIQETTGCSIGKGNLLFFHRPVSYPFKVVLFKKDIKDAVIITYDGEKAGMINVKMEGFCSPGLLLALFLEKKEKICPL